MPIDNQVDSVLLNKLKQAPEISHPVLISCESDYTTVKQHLLGLNIKITGEMAMLNLLNASISYSQLQGLETVPGIEYIEGDDEAHTY